jgi:hypothetical protein
MIPKKPAKKTEAQKKQDAGAKKAANRAANKAGWMGKK